MLFPAKEHSNSAHTHLTPGYLNQFRYGRISHGDAQKNLFSLSHCLEYSNLGVRNKLSSIKLLILYNLTYFLRISINGNLLV